MTETQVEARIGADGDVTILNFTWHNQPHPVVSHGRQWTESGRRHVLVMTADHLTFELAGDLGAWRWMIVREPERRHSA